MRARYFLLSVAALAFVEAADAKTASAQAGKPELGSFGIDTAQMDKSVKPGDDFFRYVNGTWLDTFELPADRPNYGSFTRLSDLSEERTRKIIQDLAASTPAAGTNARKIADIYNAFMDEARIEQLGIAPVKPDLDRIQAITSQAALIAEFVRAAAEGRNSPIGFDVAQDAKNAQAYALYTGQRGLGLPDRDFYLEDTPRFKEVRAKYVAHIGKMLALAGIDAPEKRAADIMALETKMAQSFWTRVQSRDRDKTYNKFSLADWSRQTGGFDWAKFLADSGITGAEEIIVAQPSAVQNTIALLGSEPLDVWKSYLIFHSLRSAAPLLSKAFVEEQFDFSGRTLNGIPVNRERWKRAVSMVNSAMGEAVGEVYVARHFTPEAKTRMDALVKNVMAVFEERLARLEWMSPATRKEALAKLAAFKPKIGYPAKWLDYSGLHIDPQDAFGNMRRASMMTIKRNRDKFGKPVDRDEWFMTPQTVNAYYSPSMNEIVFPAAILQPPFFDPHADDAVNYGGIGAVIGHEIGHGFDDQGSKSDGNGNLRNWWTAEDRRRFEAKTGALAGQYDRFCPFPDACVNGKLSLGENIGDLGGVNVAYAAYRKSLNGKKAPKIDGTTGDQRFFMAWAQVWRVKWREAALRQQLTVGPHSPGEYRANGVVRNMDAWYKAFNVTPDNKMYLPKDQRIKIW